VYWTKTKPNARQGKREESCRGQRAERKATRVESSVAFFVFLVVVDVKMERRRERERSRLSERVSGFFGKHAIGIAAQRVEIKGWNNLELARK
jgi:hypothetical protein